MNSAPLASLKLFAVDPAPLKTSIKPGDLLGLIVLPKLYFSPDGDLGGVRPFYVGLPAFYFIFVINKGLGGAASA